MINSSDEESRNILIVGSGGREHALGWKLRQSKFVNEIYFAPGNGGTHNNIAIESSQVSDLISFAKKYDCLTIVGPELPLAKGLVDSFLAADLSILGPSMEGALLESSKAFSKQFMKENNIPTADFRVFTDSEKATAYVKSRNVGLVIKVDGLASGKGVFVSSNPDDALLAIDRTMVKKEFGEAGNKIIVEEKLTGKEVSLIVLTDGKNFELLASAKDYKRILDNDLGFNTGGMGSFSPVPFFSDDIYATTLKKIVRPTMNAIRTFPKPFKGFLYFGLLLEEFTSKPYLLEFNVRMGDPECQAIMMRMKSDLYPYIRGTLSGALDNMDPMEWSDESAVCVVMASRGYPGRYKSGLAIRGIDSDLGKNVTVFHAGTSRKSDSQLITNGGRVLGVAARGANLHSAAAHAYDAVSKISWGDNDQYYRKDIAQVTG
ncbi:MAG: phosphoribosylamine--glycine ligase [Nitrososphaeraceae archaeon]